MECLFECSTWYFTIEHCEQVRYKVEHEKRNSISTSNHVIFCLLYKHTRLIMAFLTIFRRIPKILQKLSKGHTNISEDYRRLLKTFEIDWKMFWSYTNKFKYSLRVKDDISEVINIFTREDMEDTPPKSQMWFRVNFISGVLPVKHSCL